MVETLWILFVVGVNLVRTGSFCSVCESVKEPGKNWEFPVAVK